MRNDLVKFKKLSQNTRLLKSLISAKSNAYRFKGDQANHFKCFFNNCAFAIFPLPLTKHQIYKINQFLVATTLQKHRIHSSNIFLHKKKPTKINFFDTDL